MNIEDEIIKLFKRIDTTQDERIDANEIAAVKSKDPIFASILKEDMNIDEFIKACYKFDEKKRSPDDEYRYARNLVLKSVWSQDIVDKNKFNVATLEGIPIPAHLNFNNTDGKYMLRFLSFDLKTFLNTPTKNLPEGWDPNLIFEQGKNPGCNVRAMHDLGYTGAGINVAIIDSPILTKHSEIKSSLVSYQGYSEFNQAAAFHGQAVSGILVGDETGIAKDAGLYYFAVNTQTTDKRLSALEKILEHNATCNPHDKIQVVSLSWGINKGDDEYEEYRVLLKKLYDSGVFVATADYNMLDSSLSGVSMPYGILSKKNQAGNPDDFSNYYMSSICCPGEPQDMLLVPCGDRTVASAYGEGKYRHDSGFSTSWTVPALAGVYACALQCANENNVELTPALFWQYALKAGVEIKDDSGNLVGKAINAEALCLHIENLGKQKLNYCM